MASQVNTNYAYLFLINGETVWERLRIVRNFIEDRTIAKNMEQIHKKRGEAHLAKIAEATSNSERLLAECDYEEYLARDAQVKDGYVKLDAELKFLTDYEAALAAEAELSRVNNYTDDEMYQYNTPYEIELRNTRKIQTERIANTIGCSTSTIDEALKIPNLRDKLLTTVSALTLPQGELRNKLLTEGINFDNLPPVIGAQFDLEKKLLLK